MWIKTYIQIHFKMSVVGHVRTCGCMWCTCVGISAFSCLSDTMALLWMVSCRSFVSFINLKLKCTDLHLLFFRIKTVFNAAEYRGISQVRHSWAFFLFGFTFVYILGNKHYTLLQWMLSFKENDRQVSQAVTGVEDRPYFGWSFLLYLPLHNNWSFIYEATKLREIFFQHI